MSSLLLVVSISGEDHVQFTFSGEFMWRRSCPVYF